MRAPVFAFFIVKIYLLNPWLVYWSRRQVDYQSGAGCARQYWPTWAMFKYKQLQDILH
jgi:hypothetical protein